MKLHRHASTILLLVGVRVLTVRELNRALLARQLLLQRRSLPVPEAVTRLGALQAQWSPSPYIALWSRLENFRIPRLERALATGKVVKTTLMRSTLHVVSSADYFAFAAAIVSARRSRVERSFPDVSLDAVADRLRDATSEPPRSWNEWRELVVELAGRPIKPGEIWPLWTVGFMHARLVHLPPSGTYGFYRGAHFIPAENWLGAAPEIQGPSMTHLVSRYLAAFGPASVDDLKSWTGVPAPAIRHALGTLTLREFRDEKRRRLFDLPRLPLPPADTPAPVRFLPKWDSALLAYAPPERERILPERYRKRVIATNGDVAPTLLMDGFVAGTWRVEKDRVRLEPFARLSKGERGDLEAEGERLVDFLP
jgi:DNA glycosylase AlkZ-like